MQSVDFSQVKVLIVGDLMLDRYWMGGTGRISPEAPVPVVKVEQSDDKPGGAANVALNAASLGAQVTLLGLCGQDEAADTLEKKLTALKVDCQFVRLPDYETITKLRVMSRNQQLIRLDFERSFVDADQQDLLARFAAAVSEADVVILSDYAKGSLQQVQQLIQMARTSGKTVVVDPKGSDFTRYRGATLLTPNMSEFEHIVGACDSEQQIVDKGQQLCNELDLAALLVTRSEQGMTLLEEAQQALHLPAKAREVYDVTGAGDTVISTLALGLGVGLATADAAALANLAASIVVAKLGTASVTVNELQHADLQKLGGVVNQAQLQLAMQQARARGERIVMTNGCFDILHAGHVSYLDAARQLGDRLIVAVNSDESVTRLKGEGRPINPLDRRMAVLAGLAAVDWVVPFGDDTPQALIATLLPDILVKGGDYRIEQIAGGKEVQDNGGEVRVLHFEQGVSTTRIIQTIVEQQG